MSPIHIAYALHDPDGAYAKFVGASLASVFLNTASPLKIHLISDETLTETNGDKFRLLAEEGGHDIEFYTAHLPPGSQGFFGDFQRLNPRFTPGTIYRLALGEILPGEIGRLIYLDADTVVHLDIARLWEENLAGAAVCAVPDGAISQSADMVAPPLITKGMVARRNYFNAGVLLLDLNLLRSQENFLAKSCAFMAEYPDLFQSYMDQDVLNYVCREAYRPLPEFYNLLVGRERAKEASLKAGIYHYANGSLGCRSHDAFDRLFWHYMAMTPWCDGEFILRCLNSCGTTSPHFSLKNL